MTFKKCNTVFRANSRSCQVSPPVGINWRSLSAKRLTS
ncbi:hypothetical protein N0824_01735 [Microcystis sp. 0824]|uniref:Uncharacterized protein n=1 Tax=Microcystis aeruginosa NIES-2549 TaxID=1641812 RepID=A0A0F6RMZ9_MICAE|nr:hypothetical protein MYAER_3365 [Microcystis aeruginosa NIES-2549]AOC54107.1 hypothetical protein amyaer_3402 [Microcystis aeruginosa NIES-2481]GBF53878.1 hypothetical protein N0824_01735 [Microcystis sp. 0824]